MIVIGIDPGASGAAVALQVLPNGDLRWLDCLDLPMIKDGRGSRLDSRAFSDWLLSIAEIARAEGMQVLPKITIEDVWAFGGSGKSSQLIMIRIVGQLIGCCETCGLDVMQVLPNEWKKSVGLADLIKSETRGMSGQEKKRKAKSLAREVVADMVPGAAGNVARAKDADRAEAALIALWASLRCDDLL